MCEPTTAALVALSVGSTAASLYANKEQAEFEAKQNQQNTIRNNQAAMQAYELDTQQLGMVASQELEAFSDEKLKMQLATQKSIATARTAGAESGLAGYSLDSSIDDFFRQGANNLTNLDANLESSKAVRGIERKSLYEAAKNRQQSFKPYEPSSTAFYTGAALQLGSSGVQGYSAGKSLAS